MNRVLLDRKELRQLKKKQKLERKQREREHADERRNLYVLDFKGDIHASATASLREEVSAILAVATKGLGNRDRAGFGTREIAHRSFTAFW